MDVFYPLQLLADWLSFGIFGLAKDSVFGEAVSFFIYDTIKIFLLLCTIIFAVSYIRSYFPPEKIRDFLNKRAGIGGNVLAALFGIITPFCSCSAVPLFIGMVEAGVPLGVTFSYLISAPMVNEVAAVLLWGLFGWKIALIYIASGVIIAIVVGYILGKMKLESQVEDYVWKLKSKHSASIMEKSSKERLREAYDETASIVKKVFPWVVLGVAIGAFIHGYAPQNLLLSIGNYWWTLPIIVLIGVPLYSNAAGTIPIVTSLIEKGLPIGSALAFMMSITALSLPEMIVLRRVLKPKLLFLYFGVVTVGIIIIGYMFNWIL